MQSFIKGRHCHSILIIPNVFVIKLFLRRAEMRFYISFTFLLASFYMGESFLITHLDGGGHLKGRKFGQTSVISQTVVVLLNNFFSQPSIVRDIVFWGKSWFRNCSVISSSRWRQRFAKYWIYLGSLLAQNFFTKQIRFASSTTSMPLSLKYYHHFGHKDMLISLNQYQVRLHLM